MEHLRFFGVLSRKARGTRLLWFRANVKSSVEPHGPETEGSCEGGRKNEFLRAIKKDLC